MRYRTLARSLGAGLSPSSSGKSTRAAAQSDPRFLQTPLTRHLKQWEQALYAKTPQEHEFTATHKKRLQRDSVKTSTMPRVARIRVPIYQETGKHTLYRIEVTTDGRPN